MSAADNYASFGDFLGHSAASSAADGARSKAEAEVYDEADFAFDADALLANHQPDKALATAAASNYASAVDVAAAAGVKADAAPRASAATGVVPHWLPKPLAALPKWLESRPQGVWVHLNTTSAAAAVAGGQPPAAGAGAGRAPTSGRARARSR